MLPQVGICQFIPSTDLNSNLEKAKKYMNNCIEKKANIIVLPECWNCPYGVFNFKKYASELDSDDSTIKFLREFSNINKYVYIIAGSIPEKHQDKIYNTCTIWYGGEIIDFYRKIHLFDIEIPGQCAFQESSIVTPGKSPTYFKTKWGNIGIGICYDLRFPNLSKFYREHDCFLICYPGAFTVPTGEMHWELLNRSQALNNQLFVVSCSPARDKNADYVSYGHSIIVDPWARVLHQMNEKEGFHVEQLNLESMKNIRKFIPVLKHQKTEVSLSDI